MSTPTSRSSLPIRRVALLGALLALQLGAQQTWVVASGNYNGLRDAVSQARPGDLVLVQGGSFAAPDITKGLTILCDPNVDIGDPFGGATRIRSIPASQRVVIRGGHWFVGHNLAGLFVDGCNGPVILEELTNSRNLQITECASVHLNRCTVNELVVRGSRVVVSDGAVGGGFFPAVQASDSTLTLHSTSVNVAPLFDRDTIQLTRGQLTLTGNGMSVLNGGATATAIRTQGGVVRLDPGVTLSSPNGPILGNARIVRGPIPAARGDGVTPGQTFHGSTYAPAGDLAYTFASWPILPLDTPFGRLWVDPNSPFLDVGIVPATGVRNYSSPVPALPMRGIPLTLQAISIGPNLTLRIGEPATVVLD